MKFSAILIARISAIKTEKDDLRWYFFNYDESSHPG